MSGTCSRSEQVRATPSTCWMESIWLFLVQRHNANAHRETYELGRPCVSFYFHRCKHQLGLKRTSSFLTCASQLSEWSNSRASKLWSFRNSLLGTGGDLVILWTCKRKAGPVSPSRTLAHLSTNYSLMLLEAQSPLAQQWFCPVMHFDTVQVNLPWSKGCQWWSLMLPCSSAISWVVNYSLEQVTRERNRVPTANRYHVPQVSL